MQDVWHHPQLQARQRWTEVETPIGKVPTLKPVGLKNESDFVIKAVPFLGENSEQILQELGYDQKSIKSLSENSVI